MCSTPAPLRLSRSLTWHLICGCSCTAVAFGICSSAVTRCALSLCSRGARNLLCPILFAIVQSALKQFEHAHARWREECNRSPSGFVVVSAIPATGGRIITDDDDEGGRVVPVGFALNVYILFLTPHAYRSPHPFLCGRQRRRSIFARRWSSALSLNGASVARCRERWDCAGELRVNLVRVMARRWVDDIFAGGGSETPFSIDWAGSAGDPAVGCSAEGDTAAAPPTADAAALVEAPMVEVEAVFDCLAGRTAFLRVKGAASAGGERG